MRFSGIIFLLLVLGVGYRTVDYLTPSHTDRTTRVDRLSSNDFLVMNPTVGPGSGDQGDEYVDFAIVAVTTGLQVPWAVVQTSSDRLLVTERPGRVRQIVQGKVLTHPVLTITEISNKAEEGLMSIVLDPAYEQNKYLYLSYAYRPSGTMAVRIVRYTDVGDRLIDPVVIWDMLPAAQRHAGSALAFGPDGHLYITVGDAVDKELAQSLDTLHGKILRIASDGSIPADNPFSGSAIWSLGHRNSQGIARTADGVMYASEHGPSTFDGPPGGDEIDRIIPGGNYGRPIVSHEEQQTGMIDPIAIYTPAIAPASLMIYQSDTFPQRKGDLFVGMLRGEGILRVHIDPRNPDRLVETEKLIDDRFGRIRFVGQAPDGTIYFTTSNEDGRGQKRPDGDVVYQIHPKTINTDRLLSGTVALDNGTPLGSGEVLPSYLATTVDGDDLRFERILETNAAYTRYQISYRGDGLRISGVMNVPTGTGSFPLLILNHGYIDPAVYTNGRGLKREQDYLARQGFAVVHTDYRNHAFSDEDLELNEKPYLRTQKYGLDALNAIAAVRQGVLDRLPELAGVDPGRVGMLGHSMGGGVTMYGLVSHPELIDAAVLYAPVHSHEYYNFHRWMKNRLDASGYTALEQELGSLDSLETFASFSPETYFDRIQAPVQIYFGTADESCPVERGRTIRDGLQAQGVGVDLVEYEGEGHEFSRAWQSFMEGVSNFFAESW